jgi:prevent-host-death family protein
MASANTTPMAPRLRPRRCNSGRPGLGYGGGFTDDWAGPAADARAKWKDLLDAVESTHERFLITRHGHAGAVLMSAEDLEALEETLDILSDPEEVKAIQEGIAAADRGEFFTLEEVRKDMGL